MQVLWNYLGIEFSYFAKSSTVINSFGKGGTKSISRLPKSSFQDLCQWERASFFPWSISRCWIWSVDVYENLLTSIFCLITRMWHALSRRSYEPDMFSSEYSTSLKLLGGQNSCLTRQRLIRRVFVDYRFAMAKGTARIWLDPSSVICFCLELSINSVRLSSSASRTGILHIYHYTNQSAIKLSDFIFEKFVNFSISS